MNNAPGERGNILPDNTIQERGNKVVEAAKLDGDLDEGLGPVSIEEISLYIKQNPEQDAIDKDEILERFRQITQGNAVEPDSKTPSRPEVQQGDEKNLISEAKKNDAFKKALNVALPVISAPSAAPANSINEQRGEVNGKEINDILGDLGINPE